MERQEAEHSDLNYSRCSAGCSIEYRNEVKKPASLFLEVDITF